MTLVLILHRKPVFWGFYNWYTRLFSHKLLLILYGYVISKPNETSVRNCCPWLYCVIWLFRLSKTRSRSTLWNHYLKNPRDWKDLPSLGHFFHPSNWSSYLFLVEKLFIKSNHFPLLSCVFLVLLSSWDGETRAMSIQDNISVNLCGDKLGSNAEALPLRSQSIWHVLYFHRTVYLNPKINFKSVWSPLLCMEYEVLLTPLFSLICTCFW